MEFFEVFPEEQAMVLKTVCDLVKISDIDHAIGKKLKTVNFGNSQRYLLLGFEDGMYCQLNVDIGYERGDDQLEQGGKFDWTEYSSVDLIKEGILTAEWVAEQRAESERKRKQDQEKHERDMLILLKKKYEEQP